MTEEEWHRFVWGREPQIITIGELPQDLCRVMGTASPLIRMEHFYALKAAQKHGLEAREFPMLEIAIGFGRCLLDAKGGLTFLYFDEHVFGKWFHVTLDVNADRTELWVSTFHRSRPGEVRRITRKRTIIRPEKW
jgi:hypothetical protein